MSTDKSTDRSANKLANKSESDGTETISAETYPYNYEHMLYQLHILKEEDLFQIKNTKTVLEPIKLSKKGKTIMITNFSYYPQFLNRPAEHISKFFKDEVGSSTSINGDGQLLILGRLREVQIENLMRNYIKQYVKCSQCKCIQTDIVKEDRISYIVCHRCNAKTSLAKNN